MKALFTLAAVIVILLLSTSAASAGDPSADPPR